MNTKINYGNFVLGIDAVNIQVGGGVTHLIEWFKATDATNLVFSSVIIWGGDSTLNAIGNYPWLIKKSHSFLNKGLLWRTIWQMFFLSREVRSEGCSVLFIPGGSNYGNFSPVVTMNQNLLPFELNELLRYGFSLTTLKLLLLRIVHIRSIRNSDGIIFLTSYAYEVVTKVVGKFKGLTTIIPHGHNPLFSSRPKEQMNIKYYNNVSPLRLLYVSTIDQFKHQWNVVEAVNILRIKGFPITLNLVGNSYPTSMRHLNLTIDRLDPHRGWVCYQGHVPYPGISEMYKKADIAIWASTCETFGIVLLEAMASGLPIASSMKRPAPDILADAGVYFNPESPDSIASVLQSLIESPSQRAELAFVGHQIVKNYSWYECSNQTFSFLKKIAIDHRPI